MAPTDWHDVSFTYTWRQILSASDTAPPGLIVQVTLRRPPDGSKPWAGLRVSWRADAATAVALGPEACAELASLLAATGLPARAPRLEYRCHSGLFGYEARITGVVDGQAFVFDDGGWAVEHFFTSGPDAPAWKALVANLGA
jgi:hypothetical protein